MTEEHENYGINNSSGAPYGYCPFCFAAGNVRERRINGDDACPNGHLYPSKEALKEPLTEAEILLISQLYNRNKQG